MKKISYGFILIDNKTKKLLGCVPTGSKDGLCDIPKGCAEDDDMSAYDTALRELKEETGIDESQLSLVTSWGKMDYLPYKDLFVFSAYVDMDFDKLHCNSTFTTNDGKELPEMSGFKLGGIEIFRKSLRPIINYVLAHNNCEAEDVTRLDMLARHSLFDINNLSLTDMEKIFELSRRFNFDQINMQRKGNPSSIPCPVGGYPETYEFYEPYRTEQLNYIKNNWNSIKYEGQGKFTDVE